MKRKHEDEDRLRKDLSEIHDVLKSASVRIHEELAAHVGYRTSVAFSTKDGRPETTNASGDKQAPLDVTSDKCVERALRDCELIAGFASEERDGFEPCSPHGKYVVVFDPLDGSQNLPVGLSVGSIFGVFRATSLKEIKSGDDLVAAGYALYSAALQFVWSTISSGDGDENKTRGLGIEQFDFRKRNWDEVMRRHRRPAKGKTYCINEGSASNWLVDIQTFISDHMKGRSIRWMACMVADVHRPLMEGGSFMYPADKKYTRGRLRLVYEAYPMAFLWERAGSSGVAIRRDPTSVASSSSSSSLYTYSRILSAPFPHDDVHARCGVILLGEAESEAFKVAVKKATARGSEWGAF